VAYILGAAVQALMRYQRRYVGRHRPAREASVWELPGRYGGEAQRPARVPPISQLGTAGSASGAAPVYSSSNSAMSSSN
jgi:hypothetical protein